MLRTNLRTAISFSILVAVVAIGARCDAEGQANTEDKHGRELACGGSWLVSTAQNVGPNFGIKVSLGEIPIPAVSILLVREGSPPGGSGVVRATNSQGVAEFSGIPSGTYTAIVEEVSQEIRVDGNRAAVTEVNLQWPQILFSARRIRGWLTALSGMDHPTLQPLQLALVELLDLRSSRVLARSYTDGEGLYDLPSVAPGLYLVRFYEGPDSASPHYEAAVEVERDAIREHVPALKVGSPCGPGLSIY